MTRSLSSSLAAFAWLTLIASTPVTVGAHAKTSRNQSADIPNVARKLQPLDTPAPSTATLSPYPTPSMDEDYMGAGSFSPYPTTTPFPSFTAFPVPEPSPGMNGLPVVPPSFSTPTDPAVPTDLSTPPPAPAWPTPSAQQPSFGLPTSPAPVEPQPMYPSFGFPTTPAPVVPQPQYPSYESPTTPAPVASSPQYPSYGLPTTPAPVVPQPQYPSYQVPTTPAPVAPQYPSWKSFTNTPEPTVAYVPPTDDFVKEEVNDDTLKNEWEQKTSIEKVEAEWDDIRRDKNVKIVSIVFGVTGFLLLLFVAHQLIENPDGFFGKFCRCLLACVRILCWPVRMLCCRGARVRDRRTHQLVQSEPGSYGYSHDLELT